MSFRFEIGDLVHHVANENLTFVVYARVITEEMKDNTTLTYRTYWCRTSSGHSLHVHENELKVVGKRCSDEELGKKLHETLRNGAYYRLDNWNQSTEAYKAYYIEIAKKFLGAVNVG